MPRDARKTRERILDAAQQQVLERGFAATSVDQIQQAAGISRGTFFYHFETKDALARELIGRYAASDRELTDALMERAERLTSDPLQQALVFLALHEELFEETGAGQAGCLFASYSYEAGLFDDEIKNLIRGSIEHFRTVLGARLELALERHGSAVPDADPYVLADMAYGVMQGAFILTRALADPSVIVTHTRQLRRQLELVFGAVDAAVEA